MSLDQLARDAGTDVRDRVARIEPPAPGVIASRSRRGRLATGVAATAALVLTATGLAIALETEPEPTRLQITDDAEPTTVVGPVPVWWDADGLHRGDVVEPTPVEVGRRVGSDSIQGALALVRTGAVYLDPATGDVWFHPWDGEPRIVGHGSGTGPGGDPDGDTAAWFEGTELVVYDTATGREVSRTEQRGRIEPGGPLLGGDHYPAGNGFLQVSADSVVWTNPGLYRHDVRTGRTSAIRVPRGRRLADVHDRIEVLTGRGPPSLRVPGRAEERLQDLETHLRLSPSGNYVLAVEGTDERHAALVVDTRTGERWPVPRNVYPWIAWSYGDLALVDHTEDAFLACDPARRTCEELQAERPFLLPTS